MIAVSWSSIPVRRLIAWLTSHFVVTSDRVIHREGLIAKQLDEIPLEQINDVRFEQGVLRADGRRGHPDDPVAPANRAATNSSTSVIPKRCSGRSTTRARLNQTRHVPAGARPRRPPTAGAPSTTTELERLADLRAKGVLTEEEFQAQKARILGRR